MGVSFGGRKSKGSVAERELLRSFWDNGWGGLRCAGSGSGRHPAPDILVGNAARTIAFEVKVTKDEKKYFSKDEVDALRKFAGAFGAHPMVAVQFNNNDWFFFNADDMRETKKSYVASVDIGASKGLSLDELLSIG
jgi:Holliday junction resolvase